MDDWQQEYEKQMRLIANKHQKELLKIKGLTKEELAKKLTSLKLNPTGKNKSMLVERLFRAVVRKNDMHLTVPWWPEADEEKMSRKDLEKYPTAEKLYEEEENAEEESKKEKGENFEKQGQLGPGTRTRRQTKKSASDDVERLEDDKMVDREMPEKAKEIAGDGTGEETGEERKIPDKVLEEDLITFPPGHVEGEGNTYERIKITDSSGSAGRGKHLTGKMAEGHSARKISTNTKKELEHMPIKRRGEKGENLLGYEETEGSSEGESDPANMSEESDSESEQMEIQLQFLRAQAKIKAERKEQERKMRIKEKAKREENERKVKRAGALKKEMEQLKNFLDASSEESEEEVCRQSKGLAKSSCKESDGQREMKTSSKNRTKTVRLIDINNITYSEDDSESEDESELDERSQGKVQQIIKNWKISFSGEGKDNGKNFMKGLMSYKSSTGYDENIVLRALPMILKGAARDWFIRHRKEWKSWKNFKSAFAERYTQAVDDDLIMEELRHRLQGKGEKIQEYLDAVEHIVDHLREKPDEIKLIKIVCPRLLQEYQDYMRYEPLKSLKDVLRVGRSYERTKILNSQIRNAPRKDDALFPRAAPKEIKMNAKIAEIYEKEESSGKQRGKANKQGIKAETGGNPKEKTEKQTGEVEALTTNAQMEIKQLAEKIEMLSKKIEKENPSSNRNNNNNKPYGAGYGSRPKTTHELPQRACYGCKSPDHMLRDCPDVRCFRCNRLGHLSKDCPDRRGTQTVSCWSCFRPGVIFEKCDNCAYLRQHFQSAAGNARQGVVSSQLPPH